MKINNISNNQYINHIDKIQIGKTLYAKILTKNNDKGYLQLPNGQILQAIIRNISNLELNKFIKFYVDNINENILLLRPYEPIVANKNDYLNILNRLNIPKEIGKEIIETLIKFNIPANDFYISLIYKHYNFFKSLKRLSNEKIISLIKKFTTENITHAEETYNNIGNILDKLKEVNINHLCFLIENDLNLSIDNVLNILIFIDDIDLNEIIDSYSNKEMPKNKLIDFNFIISKIKLDSSNETLVQLKNLILLKELIEKIFENYEMYYFNYYGNNNVLRNLLIIKKEKFKNHINQKDTKLYLKISSDKFGDIDIFIYNTPRDLQLKFFINKDYKEFFSKNIINLTNKFVTKGLNVTNIEIAEKISKISIVDLNNFFMNDIVELDVKV